MKGASVGAMAVLLSMSALAIANSEEQLRDAYDAARGLLRPVAKTVQATPADPRRPVLLTGEQASELVNSLPARAVYSDSKPVLAVNLVFLGSEARVREALRGAGWFEVANSWGRSVLEGAGDLTSGRRLERFPPLREFYVEGRPQYFNWTQAVAPIESRHHFRLWRVAKSDSLGREVWPGAADFDIRVDWKRLAHEPDPHIDKERDYIAATLRESPLVVRLSLVDTRKIPHEAHEGYANFFSDSRVLVVELRPEDVR